MTSGHPAAGEALAAGWAWLSTLPRATVAHADRGDHPLAAMEALLAALGDPQARLRVIHIAGSKGKGSTALHLETLLRACGLRTFTYTSPHLQRWTERMRINGEEVDAGEAVRALDAVQGAAAATGVTPGFFEALTVAALWLAAESGVDWTIVEAGVGGRADATNVVQPAIAVITGIELEHTDRLGSSLTAIAREKAGIVKPGGPLVAPELAPELDQVLADAAQRAGSDFLRLRRSPRPPRPASVHGRAAWHLDGQALTVAGRGWSVRTRLAVRSEQLAGNAALALATAARLGLVSNEGLQMAARSLGREALPGRMETLSTLPWVIVDAAHTPASAAALADEVARLRPRRVHLLLSMTMGKDVAAVLAPLLPLARAVTVTRADADYSLPADVLAGALGDGGDIDIHVEPDPERALTHACNDRPGETLVLATGSVYLAGRIRALLPPQGGCSQSPEFA